MLVSKKTKVAPVIGDLVVVELLELRVLLLVVEEAESRPLALTPDENRQELEESRASLDELDDVVVEVLPDVVVEPVDDDDDEVVSPTPRPTPRPIATTQTAAMMPKTSRPILTGVRLPLLSQESFSS